VTTITISYPFAPQIPTAVVPYNHYIKRTEPSWFGKGLQVKTMKNMINNSTVTVIQIKKVIRQRYDLIGVVTLLVSSVAYYGVTFMHVV
jgi:hypothetical protein